MDFVGSFCKDKWVLILKSQLNIYKNCINILGFKSLFKNVLLHMAIVMCSAKTFCALSVVVFCVLMCVL